MQDRLPLYPGRVQMVPVPGQTNTYDMVRADQPTQEGTPLNKATLLSDETAQAMGLDPNDNPTPNDAFIKLTVKTVDISFVVASWVEGVEAFTQVVAVDGGTENSLVALQPSAAQMLALMEAGVSFLQVDNDSGIFTAKAGGAAPSTDMTIQATLTEVSA